MIKLKNILEGCSKRIDMNLLFESPMRLKGYNQEEFSNSGNNIMFTRKIKGLVKSDKKYKNYDYYSYKVGNIYYDLFIEGEFTICFFSYQIDKNNNFIERKVWQDGIKMGLARDILFNFYLPQFNGIISDVCHSELGENYWKKLMKESKTRGYKVYVVFDDNKNIEINTPEEMEKYYGYDGKLSNCRFFISKEL